jgi:hypothetical protein
VEVVQKARVRINAHYPTRKNSMAKIEAHIGFIIFFFWGDKCEVTKFAATHMENAKRNS